MPFKTLESKETRAQRRKTVTHNSVFAAHRLKPDGDFKIDIRLFPFRIVLRHPPSSAALVFSKSGDVPRGELPSAVASHQRVGELNYAIERLPFRFSFPPRLAKNDRHIVAIN